MSRLWICSLLIAWFLASLAASLHAQAAGSAPEFAVASVKPTPSANNGHLVTDYCRPDGSFVAQGTPVAWLLEYAFGRRDDSLAGVPSWLNDFNSAYDIEARAGSPVDKDQCKAMLRTLFTERFHLAAHEEQRILPVYFLRIVKSGTKLKHGGGVRLNHSMEVDEHGPVWPDGWTMPQLANILADRIGRPVIDQTGLQGTYGITLDFSQKLDDGLPDLTTAVEEQLGLKLASGKAPVNVLVIDHVQKPDPN